MSNTLPTPGYHFISLDTATTMNEKYRDDKDALLATGVSKDVLPICESFNREDFDDLLAQNGCVGIRFYFSMNNAGKICIVAVAINEDDEDMISGESPIILDTGVRCPSTCPPSSVLNT